VFEHDSETLLWCCKEMLVHMGLVAKFNVPEAELHAFLRLLPHYYFDNPYHNLRHGVYVMHSVFVMITSLGAGKGVFTPHQKLALLLGAVCHDIAHPGLNNPHLNAVKCGLATQYNGESVLENFHFATAWKLLSHPKYNLLKNASTEDVAAVREAMHTGIMATDMSRHFKIQEQFREMLSDGRDGEGVTTEMALQIILKVSDISNPTRPWVQAIEWNWRITDEFFIQGDLEGQVGIDPAVHMDRRTANATQGSLSFIQFICRPLFETVVEWIPGFAEMLENMNFNEAVLKEHLAKEQDNNRSFKNDAAVTRQSMGHGQANSNKKSKHHLKRPATTPLSSGEALGSYDMREPAESSSTNWMPEPSASTSAFIPVESSQWIPMDGDDAARKFSIIQDASPILPYRTSEFRTSVSLAARLIPPIIIKRSHNQQVSKKQMSVYWKGDFKIVESPSHRLGEAQESRVEIDSWEPHGG
jgi:hypothetical protein